jgi:hypothetical protein
VFSKSTSVKIAFPIAAFIAALSAVTLTGLTAEIPSNVKCVLDNTMPLTEPRLGRLPLYVLPISNGLISVLDSVAEELLWALDTRGIGYSVDWQPAQFESSLKEGLRIARLQQKIGQPVAINATNCLQAFCDGSDDTLHIDREGQRFSDDSCGAKLGCPFAIEHRIPVIRRQVEAFVNGYRDAGVSIDFIFADWEIDGPIEWNDSWSACKRCTRCRRELTGIDDFRHFQTALRQIRSRLQREAFASVVTSAFPQALVGNYGVYPHDGYRYWYDYFERPADDSMPFRQDQQARYREWYPEFPETGYTFAMPVVYTWYPTFNWYDFKSTDYRWFYNMLLTGTNSGRHTPAATPIISFVHWHTTAPPTNSDPGVVPMSASAYQELLWHLLLRGHDTFFLWCMPDELATEVRLVHEVYAAALKYRGFLDRGVPVSFDVPSKPSTVVSGLRLGDQVLVRRTEFASDSAPSLALTLALAGNTTSQVQVPSAVGNHVVPVTPSIVTSKFLHRGNELLFPIGWYELPEKDADLQELADSGVNLVRCGDRSALDRADRVKLLGWVPLSVQQGATPELRQQIASVVDHPALAVWEGPDEIVWTFTAYSFLLKQVGVHRDDWYGQRPNAVKYAESQAAIILPKMREGIELVRSLDSKHRPFWMNEAADSDLRYVRGYANVVEAIGCDYYPVRSSEFDLRSIGRMVDRWKAVGRDKPVWMVLQAFSWHPLNPERKRRYPHFSESRYMAYNAITHGAQGLLYWGANMIDDPAFRQSMYTLMSELAMLQPFLTGKEVADFGVSVIKDLNEPAGIGVRAIARQVGDDVLVILVNEDDHRHLAVDVQGLSRWNDRTLFELYGADEVPVDRGNIPIRMRPLEVKLYCTARRFESSRRVGRDYVSPNPTQ